MFIYQSRFLKRGEVWFDNEPDRSGVDWILYRNRSCPVPGVKWRYFYNRLIDLSKTSEDLLAEMEPKMLAKIRTAEQEDNICCEWCPLVNGKTFDGIEEMWNQSVEAKKRWGKLNRDWLAKMISADA